MDTSDPDRRIGNSERDAAVSALRVHLTAGRLDSQEYEERSMQARQARTRVDLDPLFADLPHPHPEDAPPLEPPPDPPTLVAPTRPFGSASSSSSDSVPPSTAVPSSEAVPSSRGAVSERGGGLVPEPWAAWVMSLTPFAALLLFFGAGHHWQWFLMIPIVGLLTYGPDGHHGHHGHRSRDRDRGRDRRGGC